jgi:hypothetical protein
MSASTSNTTYIPLSEWIKQSRQLASKNDYLLCTVNLALMLTQSLVQIASTSSAINESVPEILEDFYFDLPPLFEATVKVGDIVSENVVVCTMTCQYLAIKEVYVKVVGVDTDEASPSVAETFDEREACHALGRILSSFQEGRLIQYNQNWGVMDLMVSILKKKEEE